MAADEMPDHRAALEVSISDAPQPHTRRQTGNGVGVRLMGQHIAGSVHPTCLQGMTEYDAL